MLTTGGSTRETVAVAEALGAQVVGAAAIIDRGADPARLNLPLQALVQLRGADLSARRVSAVREERAGRQAGQPCLARA